MGTIGKGPWACFRGRGEVRGIRFEEDAVARDELEGFARLHLSGVEEVGREREEGTVVHEERDERGWAREGMKEEAAGRHGVGTYELAEGFPCADAVNRGGALVGRGEFQLGGEDSGLVCEVMALDPCVETDFTYGGLREALQESVEFREPCLWPLRDPPWVQSERRKQPWMGLAEGCDGRPIGWFRAIDDCRGDACCREHPEDFLPEGIEPMVVEVVMRIAPHGRGESGMDQLAREEADAVGEGRHAMEPGWRELAVESEGSEDAGLVSGCGGRVGVLIDRADETGEAADEIRFRVPCEGESAMIHGGGEPDLGNAAWDEGVVRFLVVGEAGTGDGLGGEGEAFLGIRDEVPMGREGGLGRGGISGGMVRLARHGGKATAAAGIRQGENVLRRYGSSGNWQSGPPCVRGRWPGFSGSD